MRPYFTECHQYLSEKANEEMPDDTLESRSLKEFFGLKRDSQLIEWLRNVEIFPYQIFPDGSVCLDFTGREFKDWLRSIAEEYREKYV